MMTASPRYLLIATLSLAACAPALAQDPVDDLATSLSAKARSIQALRSVVTSTETRAGADETTTYIVTLARDKGWRVEGADRSTTFTFINDLRNDLRLFGSAAEAHWLRAEGRHQLLAIFSRPLAALDPLKDLDPRSLVYKGTEEMDRTTVHRFSGSTTTQFIEGADPLLLRREVWIGENDGVARREVESIDGQIRITLRSDVEINPPLTTETLSTQPPPGFRVIDFNNPDPGGAATTTAMVGQTTSSEPATAANEPATE